MSELNTRAMKRRAFYPVQVLRALNGRNTLELSGGESHALGFFLRTARRRSASKPITLVAARADLSALTRITEQEQRAILENCNTRIILRVSGA